MVLTGEGGVFSAGGNLQRLQTQRVQDLPAQQASITALHDWIEAIRTYPKPVIAAVEGSAAGAGLALVLACDLVVAARSARFATAYARVGLSPDGGTSWHLARALPRALAAELLMCGDLVEAERLHALGLVNRLADTGQALQAALDLADTLHGRAPNALASCKELLDEAAHQPLSAQLDLERAHFLRNLTHANAGEGIAAFLDKRTPHWR